jgi:hypothetical protein
LTLASFGDVQVQLVDSGSSYALALLQAGIQMAVLEAVQACVAINVFCRRTLTRLRSSTPLRAIMQ